VEGADNMNPAVATRTPCHLAMLWPAV